MKYIGSKNRHSKEIINCILNSVSHIPEYWIEPFVGGFNMADKVSKQFKVIANDKNKYLIALFKYLQENKLEYIEIDSSDYKYIKDHKWEFENWIVGYIGFCSFGAKFFAGYPHRSKNRNYYKEFYNNLIKQQQLIKNISIFNEEYYNCPIIKNSIVYCDPPYRDTSNNHLYKCEGLDYEYLYNWLFELKDNYNCECFLSEYSIIPEYENCFEIIWSKKVTSDLSAHKKGYKSETEKLYRVL